MIKVATRLGISLLALGMLGTAAGAAGLEHGKASNSALETPQLNPDKVQVGQGIVCDTAKEVERVASLIGRAGDAGDAIKVVNQETGNPIACAAIQAAFVRGGEINQVRTEKGPMKVVEITILAIPLNGEWHSVAPVKQFAAFALKGIEI
jgi:hypothetical protein